MAIEFKDSDLAIIKLALYTSCESNRKSKCFFLAADDCATLGKIYDMQGDIVAGADYYRMAETLRLEGREHRKRVECGAAVA